MADPGDKAIPYSKMTPEQKRALETTARANARQNAAAGKEPSSFEGALKELKDKLPGPLINIEVPDFLADTVGSALGAAAVRQQRRTSPQPVETSPEQKDSRVSVQTMLLRNMDLFSSKHTSVQYNRITRVHTKTPATILNKVYRKKKIKPFFDIKPHQLAALVPKIKLYLVHDGDGAEKKSIKIPLAFKDQTGIASIKNITNTKYGRGDGVGIKSFSVETQGTNPAEGGLVKCTLNVFFQNIEMLSHQSKSEVPSSHDYIELILRRTKEPKKVKDSKNQTIPHARLRNRYGFRLMAVVGWQIPRGHNSLTPELIRSLEECKQTIYLTLVDHTIDFRQDGTAMLMCEYQGAIEQILSSDHYDVLAVSQTNTLVQQIDKLQEEIDNESKKGESLKQEGGNSTEIKELQKKVVDLKQQRNKIDKQLRTQRYAQIINKLYVPTPPRIGTIDLTPEQVEALKSGQPLVDAAAVITDNSVIVGNTDAKVREAHSERLQKVGGTKKFTADDDGEGGWFKDLFRPKAPEQTRASFIYFGDLVDIATEVIENNYKLDKGNSPNARILLGPVSYHHKLPDGTIQRKQVNLADVPISLKSFEYWFNKNVTKQKRNGWALRGFLKSAVSELVLNALGEHSPADEGLRRNNMVGVHSFLVRTQGEAPAIQGSDYDLDASTFILGDAEKDKMENMTPYILVYGSIETPDRRVPNWKTDFDDGIYHFNIGSDYGLLKSASFQKTDVRGLREARFTTQDAEEAQLRDKYDVSIDLVGSSFLFTPGQKIYVNPTLTGLGNITSLTSTARMLGLGGYYDVIKVLSTYDRDRGYVTNLHCVWTSFGMSRFERMSLSGGVVTLGLEPSSPKNKTRSITSPPSPETPSAPKGAPSPPGRTPPQPVESDLSQRLKEKQQEDNLEEMVQQPRQRSNPEEEAAQRLVPRRASDTDIITRLEQLEDNVARAQNAFDSKMSNINRSRLLFHKRNLEEFNKDLKRDRDSIMVVTRPDGTVTFP